MENRDRESVVTNKSKSPSNSIQVKTLKRPEDDYELDFSDFDHEVSYETVEDQEQYSTQTANTGADATPGNVNKPKRRRGKIRKPKIIRHEEWDNPLEFLMSCISMSVGLGNVWRFPFIVYENGGGAFLLPYIVVLIFIGRPIYYLEMCVGQFSSVGQVKVWNMAPFFKGIGYGQTIGLATYVSYYTSIMSITLYYFGVSFSPLPWLHCDTSWGGASCLPDGSINKTKETYNVSISSLYFQKKVFPQKQEIYTGLGPINKNLAICLFSSWFLVYMCLIKGFKSSGKVAYFTAIFPYVVLLVLLVRALTLEGALDGIRYFLKPQWDKVISPEVWVKAVNQCFFSLNIGAGAIIMLASHNPFKHNVARDAMIISFMDTLTSILAGLTVFAVLGFLSHESGVPVDMITNQGHGLAFVSYPAAIAQFSFVPNFFSLMFFLMFICLGLGSVTTLTGSIITVVLDDVPRWNKHRWLVTLVVCLGGFLSGLLYITEGGLYMIDFMDFFGSRIGVYFLAITETLVICWVYGISNICNDIQFMMGERISWFWKLCWAVIVPVGLLSIRIFSFLSGEQVTSSGRPFPKSFVVAGWILAACILLTVPVVGVYNILNGDATKLKLNILLAFQPTKQWGPQDLSVRRNYYNFLDRTKASGKSYCEVCLSRSRRENCESSENY